MPRTRYNEDLFKDTTMTFGEHLEELRVCLFKAVLGLMAGLIVGLFVGDRVVAFIQSPLERALTNYYQTDSLNRMEEEAARLEAEGQPLPETREQIEALIRDENMLSQEVFLDPRELVDQLKERYPKQFDGFELPAADPEQAISRNNLLRLFLWHPAHDDPRVRAKSLNAHEAFMIWLKASLLVGAVLSSPWVFYQIWQFVAAGLYPHERRYVNVFLPFSVALFLLGVGVAFFLVFEPVLTFLFSFNRSLGIDPDPRISEWLSFVLMLPLGFGVAFQLPLVMLFLERIGILTVKAYLSYWRVAILAIFVIAAILTPPDPWSMTLLAFPLTLLYFGGILLCRFMPRGPGLLPLDE